MQCFSGSVLDLRGSDPAEVLCCVLEQDYGIFLCLVLVQPRKTGNYPDLTEKLLTGM